MVSRIREILAIKQLTPTQFADTIGVARPIVSHILSGRNKPSLEVVQKISAAFQDIALPWLLSGTGDMLATVAESAAGPGDTAAALPLARRSVAKAPKTPLVAKPEPAPDSSPTEAVKFPETAQMEEAEKQAEQPLASAASAAPAQPRPPMLPLPTTPAPQSAPTDDFSAVAQSFAEPGKSIRRIVIFYHDGTFSAYQPER